MSSKYWVYSLSTARLYWGVVFIGNVFEQFDNCFVIRYEQRPWVGSVIWWTSFVEAVERFWAVTKSVWSGGPPWARHTMPIVRSVLLIHSLCCSVIHTCLCCFIQWCYPRVFSWNVTIRSLLKNVFVTAGQAPRSGRVGVRQVFRGHDALRGQKLKKC